MVNRREKRARATQKGRRAMTELMKKGLLPTTEAEGAEPVKERKKTVRKPKAEELKTEAVQPQQEQAEKETTTVFVQYAGLESEVGSLTKAALADFKASHKNADVTSLNLYIKPEDHAAYYVINGEFTGKVEL